MRLRTLVSSEFILHVTVSVRLGNKCKCFHRKVYAKLSLVYYLLLVTEHRRNANGRGGTISHCIAPVRALSRRHMATSRHTTRDTSVNNVAAEECIISRPLPPLMRCVNIKFCVFMSNRNMHRMMMLMLMMVLLLMLLSWTLTSPHFRCRFAPLSTRAREYHAFTQQGAPVRIASSAVL